MLKIVVVEDNDINLELLRSLIIEYVVDREIFFQMSYYKTGEDLLNDFSAYDIYMLDVGLPGINGIELGKEIRKRDKFAKIIYVSGDSQHAVATYENKTFAFLVKPISKEKLFSVLDAVRQEIKEEIFIVNTSNGERRFRGKKLKYIDIQGRCAMYHMVDGEALSGQCLRTSFAKAIPELVKHSDYVFVEPSLLIRIDQIREMEKDNLTFEDGERLYFPKVKYQKINDAWKAMKFIEPRYDD